MVHPQLVQRLHFCLDTIIGMKAIMVQNKLTLEKFAVCLCGS